MVKVKCAALFSQTFLRTASPLRVSNVANVMVGKVVSLNKIMIPFIGHWNTTTLEWF